MATALWFSTHELPEVLLSYPAVRVSHLLSWHAESQFSMDTSQFCSLDPQELRHTTEMALLCTEAFQVTEA